MTYSTLTTQYQITLPSVVRKGLGAKPGDRIVFFESNETGTGFFVAKIPDLFTQRGSLAKYKKNAPDTWDSGDLWADEYLKRTKND